MDGLFIVNKFATTVYTGLRLVFNTTSQSSSYSGCLLEVAESVQFLGYDLPVAFLKVYCYPSHPEDLEFTGVPLTLVIDRSFCDEFQVPDGFLEPAA